MKKNKVPVIKYLLIYTLCFIVCAGVMFMIFKTNGKSYLWVNDGIYQHFISFNYLCDTLRDVFSGKGISIFNFTIGQGADIITSLNSYDILDPISIITALITPLSRVSRYAVMVYIKLWLVGLSFSYYCFSIGKKKIAPILCGAISYTFSAGILFFIARHPNFVNWAYFFPFMVGSVELYIRKKKKLPLIIFVFLNIVVSFYTFYMDMVLVVIYVAVRLVCAWVNDRNADTFKKEFMNSLRTAGVCIIGVLLASVVLFPTIYAYLNNSRMMDAAGYTASSWHFDKAYYAEIFESMFKAYRRPGLIAAVFMPCVIMFMRRGKNLLYKSLLILSVIMYCIPIVCRFMNGMSYATDRWTFVIAFYAGCAFVSVFEDLGNVSLKEKIVTAVLAIAYIGVWFIDGISVKSALSYLSIIAFLLCVVMFIVITSVRGDFYKAAVPIVTVLSAAAMVFLSFDMHGSTYINFYLPLENYESAYIGNSGSAVQAMNDDSFYRIDHKETVTNTENYNNVNGSTQWWSQTSTDIYDYYNYLDLDTVSENCKYNGLDGRTGLMQLASVKYYTASVADSSLVPFGYEKVNYVNDTYNVFENKNAASIGYTYDKSVSKEYYDSLNGIQREQALMQGAVIDEKVDGIEEIIPEDDSFELEYEITALNNAELNEKSITSTENGGNFVLTANVPEEHEIYLYIDGIEVTDDVDYVDIRATRTAEDYSVSKDARISTPKYSWGVKRDGVAFNLGCGGTGKSDITLVINGKNTLSFDELSVVAVPMKKYEERAEALTECMLGNVVIGNDIISGSAAVDETRIMQFSIPYSPGWSAYVDGEKTELLRSGGMYSAVVLQKGKHEIVLKYKTPYMRLGMSVSAITLAAYIMVEFYRKKKRKYN